MIKFDKVSKLYPGSDEILQGISFEIEQGELVYVTGHSGAGKSTLLKLMAAIGSLTGAADWLALLVFTAAAGGIIGGIIGHTVDVKRP